MTFHDYVSEQIEIALSDVNRYFFWERYGREAKDDEELLAYFAQFGAEEYSQTHRSNLIPSSQ
jgi:hypothetical protein